MRHCFVQEACHDGVVVFIGGMPYWVVVCTETCHEVVFCTEGMPRRSSGLYRRHDVMV